jgi:hypothetical protein
MNPWNEALETSTSSQRRPNIEPDQSYNDSQPT